MRVLGDIHRLGRNLAELQRGSARRIFFEPVMALDDLDIDAASANP